MHFFHFYSISCSQSTDAWKRLVTCRAPLSFCIQIVRFQNDGKKLHNLIDYKEKVLFPEHQISSNKGTTVTNVPYQLKAVIVHEGTTISSGHYVCYLKRGERWYFSSDTTVQQSSHLEATSQEAYLLFYEKDEVEDMQEVTHISSMSFKVQNCQPQMPSMPLKRKKFPVKFCLPPGYYALKAEKPGIFKTATGSIPWKYSTLDAASISKAEGIAMAGVQISGNPRIKAWELTDIEKLLPAKHKISDGKLSNFVIDYIFLLIESQSQASNKKVFTVNSDVYNNMAQFSMNIFLKHKYDLLYENISAADMILCPVLHGDHWCLVAIDLKERRMVYLDSLFNGVGAQTAFTRFAYFLECAFVSQSKVLDWKEWQYYIIPSTEIEQQTNSVDCGVFVVKWAQHIAEGRPLDFSQTQIDDFRYSLILDIANGDGSLSNLATEPGQVSDDQARPFLASSGLANDCGKANNSSCTNLKGKVQKQPYQADSDSDFESPKKRQKTDPCRESPLVSGNDHTYAKDAKQPDIHTRGEQIPECAQKIFPSGYQYKCHEFREMPMDNFTGAPKDNFYVKLSVSHITTKEDVDHWLQQFTASSNIKYNAQGGYKRKGVKVIYAQWYICQCKRKKLTKKQVTEKEAALKRKQKRHGTHKDNSGMEGCDLHLLSKAREKKTDCNSKMSIRINRNKKMPYQCEIDLWWNHNHSVHCFHLTSFCPILPATRDKFCTYFEEGMSASEAFHYHETQLMKDPVTLMLSADRKMSPSLPDVNNLYGKWLIEKKGPSNGSAMFDQLEKIVKDYNRKNANIGGKCFLQRVQGNGADQKHLILSICTPLMSRMHTTKQAGEMAFMDSSGSLD